MIHTTVLEKSKKSHLNIEHACHQVFFCTAFNFEAHCLKNTQNISFELFIFGIFHQFFVLSKMTCLVTLFDHKLHIFKISPKRTIFGIFG